MSYLMKNSCFARFFTNSLSQAFYLDASWLLIKSPLRLDVAKATERREKKLFNPLIYPIMPNWCTTNYVITGNVDEIDNVYGIMRQIEETPNPSTDFHPWLGDLVTAMEGNWKDVRCRGEWTCLERTSNNTIEFLTETAWCPMNEVLDLVCSKYPTLRYYYMAEEPGFEIFETNDELGMYFTDICYLDVKSPDGQFFKMYFDDETKAFKMLSDTLGISIETAEDIAALDNEWRELHDDCFCIFRSIDLANS
jgi:hypothetical protein